ncbi:MAG: bifunctional riboflavin kinase/FAD synthetase [Prevotellaceae bacterium]|nr:bifunctional riboflavin kinase/FAD synthetase [Prevotellaceae bacterium]
MDKNSEILNEKVFATIGFFDGVHKGHDFLLGELVKEAKQSMRKSMIVTFLNHPKLFFCPNKQLKLITPLTEKLIQLNEYAIDYCLLLEFDEAIATMTAEEFMVLLKNQFSVKSILLGFNNHFGSDKITNIKRYNKLTGTTGVAVKQLNSCKTLSLNNRVSSSVIRNFLKKGDIAMVNAMLGKNYYVIGEVVKGNSVGRTIGFPTANIRVGEDKLLPSDGVYYVEVIIDGKRQKGMMNIGYRPTVSGTQKSVEVHILDFDRDIYGTTVEIVVNSFLRKEIKFDTLDELKSQLVLDKMHIRTQFGSNKNR